MAHWIGLDLFNDDTCPSGNISRPTHVNVSQSCFHSLNKLLISWHNHHWRELATINKTVKFEQKFNTFLIVKYIWKYGLQTAAIFLGRPISEHFYMWFSYIVYKWLRVCLCFRTGIRWWQRSQPVCLGALVSDGIVVDLNSAATRLIRSIF